AGKRAPRTWETPSPWPCKDSCDKPRRSNRGYSGRTTMRIHLAKLAAMLALATALPAAAWAQAPVQSWPRRSIKMIVPFPAGGGTDFIARLAAKHLSERLGQQVFVENRAGANGAIGLQALMQSDPDGYTISTCSDTPLVVNPSLYEKLPYAPLRDFVPVATMVRFPGMLAVHPSVPARSGSELIALAKSKPAALAYASAGVGNFSHLAMELFSQATGVKLLHVPYKGTGPASLALIGGEVQMGFNNVQTLLQSVQAGQLVALAVAEPKRMPALPDLPAVAETGAGIEKAPGVGTGTVGGFEVAPWVGMVAPARTPKEIVERLSQETLAIMHDPQVVKQLTEQQVTPFALGPDRFGELIGKDLEKWAGVIKTAGIKGDVGRTRPCKVSEQPHVRPAFECGAIANPRHGPRFRRRRDQAARAQAGAPGGARAAVAGGGARPSLADGAA